MEYIDIHVPVCGLCQICVRILFWYFIWIRLYAGTVPANKEYTASAVPANKNYAAVTVPANKKYAAGIPLTRPKD